MVTVTYYFREFDDAYNAIHALSQSLKSELPHEFVLVNILSDPGLVKRYEGQVPFVKIGPYKLTPPFDERDFRVALGAALDRADALAGSGDTTHSKRLKRGRNISAADRFAYWLTKHYLLVVNLLLLIYVGLPFLAPVFMKYGPVPLADAIYRVYKPVCHQLAFRSWFLFGEQIIYPREMANIPDTITYEQIAGEDKVNAKDGRAYNGDEVYGYKVALCERDTAIYGAMLLMGLIFPLVRGKMKPLPWYWWVILGVIPMGLDGGSQLPSLARNLPDWLLLRESTPFLRVLTGGLFGITTSWYLLPILKEAMDDTRQLLAEKFTIVRQLSAHQGD